MNKIYPLTLVVLYIFIYTSVYSQNKREYNIFSLSDNSSVINSFGLNNVLNGASILDIDKSELQNLYNNKDPEISLSLPYSEENIAKLNLKRLDILTPYAKIISRTASGNEEVSLDNMVVSYTGNVAGQENSLVVMSLTKDNIMGLMSFESDNYVLGLMKNNNGLDNNDYILYKESDLKISNAFDCETNDQITSTEMKKMRERIEEMNDSSPTDLYIADIAIDVDYATFNTYGSVQNAANYALAIMTAVSAIYIKEINVQLRISYLRVWTTPDPYTGMNAQMILNQFIAEWNTNQQSVSRAIAHLISARPGNLGGIAYVDVLCNTAVSYSFSNTKGTILSLPLYSWDVEVVAHEMGHNFGSLHTHNCSWVGGAIDSCYRVEGGCYIGPPIPRVGTIMSYCMENGSISFILGFGPQPRALMRSRAQSGCLSVSSRPVVVGYPNGGEVLNKGKYLQIYWGTSLTDNVNIELSLNNGSSWQTIQNNIPASQRYIDWATPNVATTNQAKIRILSSSNSNIGDTSDAAFTISDTYLNPFNITIGIEGFWNGTTQARDTVRLYFRKYTSPYNIVDSSIVVLNSSGNAIAGFSNASGGYYYIQVKHRNSIETWSSIPLTFSSGAITNFDFTSGQWLSFGNNSKLKLGRWCFYSGDVNKDGVIDAADVSRVDNIAFSAYYGYLLEDVSGDNFVDATDLSYLDNNSAQGVHVIRP